MAIPSRGAAEQDPPPPSRAPTPAGQSRPTPRSTRLAGPRASRPGVLRPRLAVRPLAVRLPAGGPVPHRPEERAPRVEVDQAAGGPVKPGVLPGRGLRRPGAVAPL